MLDGAIRNGIAVGCWLAAGGAISHWFYRRRAEVRQLLYGPDAQKLSESDADGYKMEVVALAFACGGAWIVLFLVLDWLF